MISAQWFVKMEPLAEEAIRVVKDGETKFVPDRFTKTYTELDGKRSGLVHFPSAVVGPPDPCLDLRRTAATSPCPEEDACQVRKVRQCKY